MISDMRLIALLRPVAADILNADAVALKQLATRKADYAKMDHQPAATAMAMERRAHVGVALRTSIAPAHGWTFNEKKIRCGAYEWVSEDVVIRLAKTTPEGRLEAAKALMGLQDSLFETASLPGCPQDVVLIRLLGSPLKRTIVDAVAVGPKGALGHGVPLKAIAATSVERIIPATRPIKPTVTLPGVRRGAQSS